MLMALADYLVPVGSNINICFDCQKACGGFSWSFDFTPVPGWTAKKKMQKINYGHGKVEWKETYHITACQEFAPDDDHKPSFGEISEEQMRRLIQIGCEGVKCDDHYS